MNYGVGASNDDVFEIFDSILLVMCRLFYVRVFVDSYYDLLELDLDRIMETFYLPV